MVDDYRHNVEMLESKFVASQISIDNQSDSTNYSSNNKSSSCEIKLFSNTTKGKYRSRRTPRYLCSANTHAPFPRTSSVLLVHFAILRLSRTPPNHFFHRHIEENVDMMASNESKSYQ